MYPVGGWLNLLSMPLRRIGMGVSSNVVFLGLTSLFTDISSEMVVSVLPAYLVLFLRLTPQQFGVIDGLYYGVAATVQLLSGVISDRWQWYKPMAIVGYGLSVITRPVLLVTRSWFGIAAVLSADRLGKGLRTAPRDALISLSSSPAHFGVAFGIHRALDALGALLGPILAFVLLAWVPDGFTLVFIASFAAAVVGFAFLVLFVENRKPFRTSGRPVASLGEVIALAVLRPYRHLLLSASFLSLATINDAFVYLALQRQLHFGAGTFPILYVLTAVAYLVFSIPAGRAADMVGRFNVFVAGYVTLIVLDVLLLVDADNWVLAIAIITLLGLHYAATDGILMAEGSSLVPADCRASGLAMLTTSIALSRMASSMIFGIVWTRWDLSTATVTFMVLLCMAVAAVVISRPRRTAVEPA